MHPERTERRREIRPREGGWSFVARATVLAGVLVAGLAARPVRAGLSDIEPRIDRRPFAMLVDQTGLDEDQRMVAEMLYEDYMIALEDLAERAETRAEAAGRGRVDQALAGRVFLDPDELRRLRTAVLAEELASWEAARELGVDLLDSLGSLLGDEAAARFALAVTDVRRAMYLHPRRAGEQDERYAGDGVDIVVLAREASADDDELAAVDPAELERVLDDYRLELDGHLRSTALAARRGRTRQATARIERDGGAERAETRAALERWRELHRINRTAMTDVGVLARTSGADDAETRWRERFDRACFPRLFRPSVPERQHAWILRHVHDASVRRQADERMGVYRAQKRELTRATIALLLRARLTFGVVIHGGLDAAQLTDAGARELYQELLRSSGREASLDAAAASGLEGILTDGQRKQMRADLAAAAYGRRR